MLTLMGRAYAICSLLAAAHVTCFSTVNKVVVLPSLPFRAIPLYASFPRLPGQSLERVPEDVARARTGWPHWKSTSHAENSIDASTESFLREQPCDDNVDAIDGAMDTRWVRDVAYATTESLEASLDALEAITLSSRLSPSLRERVKRASARLANIAGSLNKRDA